MTTKQKVEAALKETAVALSELQKELGKTPEDKVLAKLDEILRAIQVQGWSRVGTCPYPHYPYQPYWYPNTTITWQGTTGYQQQQANGGTQQIGNCGYGTSLGSIDVSSALS